MEPRTLANLNGALSAANSPNKLSPPDMSPTKEFLNLSPGSRRVTISETPAVSRRVSFAPNHQELAAREPQPMTPMKEDDVLVGDFEHSPIGGSPATPYFLHPQQLTQQTCPPKQTQELLQIRLHPRPGRSAAPCRYEARRHDLRRSKRPHRPRGMHHHCRRFSWYTRSALIHDYAKCIDPLGRTCCYDIELRPGHGCHPGKGLRWSSTEVVARR